MTPEAAGRDDPPTPGGRGQGEQGGGHLSFLALDELKLGRTPIAGESDHLRVCVPCRDQGQARPAPDPPAAIPSWLSAAAARPAAPMARPRRRYLALSVLSLAAAAGATLLVTGLPEPQRPPPQVRAKGISPSTVVYLKRGDELWVWDGRSPIRPGDRLRLEVQSAGFPWVSVAALAGPAQPPAVLHEGRLGPGPGLLPVSFRADDKGTRETLSVILSQSPIPPALHASELAGSAAGTWRQIVILEKEPGR